MERGIDVRLFVAGSVKDVEARSTRENRLYFESVKALVRQLALSERVTFLGETADIAGLLAKSDVVLLPSREEPFGRVVVEAMVAGRPVVATSVGGPSEVITDGVDGWLLPPIDAHTWADQIESALSDRNALAAVGSRAFERTAGRFTAATHTRQVREQYEALQVEPYATPTGMIAVVPTHTLDRCSSVRARWGDSRQSRAATSPSATATNATIPTSATWSR